MGATRVERSGDDDAFCRKRKAHALEHDGDADDAIAILHQHVIEKMTEMKQCPGPVQAVAEESATGYDTTASETG
ncbi:hypothetical protein GKA01_07460 [Gluconobacter kanchanaburiensis NBRC 103587]|uniref:Uncharacterized protein n=1 Tax=Gluconobacter kanchanaburiensis NBRC 103587 TaxID=1307948 RepID=A0A511B539_9PROT|nr:hypothetical protein GKA01_07460 [Gluconobacter kanchanaburiensis NBRC 103587]